MEIEGIFCISLDFEKYWGLHDVVDWKTKEEQLKSVESVVERLLSTFEKYGIHASWATVGLLMDPEPQTPVNYRLGYTNAAYSPFPLDQSKYNGIPKEIISASKEVELIKQTEGQELCSHTYSHYYCLEEGQYEEQFKWDLKASNELADKHNVNFRSIVFPRNQINTDYLKLCAESGIQTFRGNQPNNLWSNSPYAKESLSKKGKRFLDAYYKISNTQEFGLEDLEVKHGMINIPASRFFRPSSGKSVLENRKVKRIKEEMERAAKNKKIYHLWWHPHNFASRTDQHFEQLEAILSHFSQLRDKYGFTSLNMGEIGDIKTS